MASAAAFVLIVMLQGWGPDGGGSKGNAVQMQEFTSEKTCNDAKDIVLKMRVGDTKSILAECTAK